MCETNLLSFPRCPHFQNGITSPTLESRDGKNKLWTPAFTVNSEKACFQPVCFWNILQCEYLCQDMFAKRTHHCYKARHFSVLEFSLGCASKVATRINIKFGHSNVPRPQIPHWAFIIFIYFYFLILYYWKSTDNICSTIHHGLLSWSCYELFFYSLFQATLNSTVLNSSQLGDSPFYPGKTTYGGAAATRSSRARPGTPYHVS